MTDETNKSFDRNNPSIKDPYDPKNQQQLQGIYLEVVAAVGQVLTKHFHPPNNTVTAMDLMCIFAPLASFYIKDFTRGFPEDIRKKMNNEVATRFCNVFEQSMWNDKL